MAAVGIVTVGATRRQLVVTIVDPNGNIVTLSATLANHALQGKSTDTPAVTINVAPTAVDTTGGVLTFDSIGTLVTQANLTSAGVKRSTYNLKVRYTDASAKLDFTDEFQFIWDHDPLT